MSKEDVWADLNVRTGPVSARVSRRGVDAPCEPEQPPTMHMLEHAVNSLAESASVYRTRLTDLAAALGIDQPEETEDCIKEVDPRDTIEVMARRIFRQVARLDQGSLRLNDLRRQLVG